MRNKNLKKVMLISTPWKLSSDSPYSKTGAIYPSLGLAYLASYIELHSNDVLVDIIDSPALNMSLDGLVNIINSEKPCLIGLSVYTTTVINVFETAKHIKKTFPNIPIVLGGPHVTVLPDEALNNSFVDFVIKGEGEKSLLKLINCLKNETKDDLSKIENLSYKNNGKILHNPTVNFAKNLDEFPMPARSKLPMDRYKPPSGSYKRLPAATVITSRGCPFQCSFCSKNIFGTVYRYHSVAYVLNEIQHLIDEYNIKEITFYDDVFTIKNDRTNDICDGIIEKGWDLTWSCSTRIDLVTKPLLEKMRTAGCISVGYGIESGDPEIGKDSNKGFETEKAVKAISWTKEAGIETRTAFIFGLPGESRKSIRMSYELAERLNSDFVIFNLAIPLPGTATYEIAKREGLLLYDGFDLYSRTDGAHQLIKVPDLAEGELYNIYKRAYKDYYFRWNYIVKRFKGIKSFDDIKINIKGLKEFLSWGISK